MQFSLKSLLLLMLIVAVVCGVLFTFPRALSLVLTLLILTLLPPVLAANILYGDERRRCFAVGSAATYAGWFVVSQATSLRDISFWMTGRPPLGPLLLLLLIAGGGGISQLVRHSIERRT